MDSYEPGLSWQKFVKQYSLNNGLTYNQAISVCRADWHQYKLQEARLAQQEFKPAKIKKQKPQADYIKPQAVYIKASKDKKKAKPAAVDPNYAQFLAWQKSQSKSRKKKYTAHESSSSDDDSSSSDED